MCIRELRASSPGVWDFESLSVDMIWMSVVVLERLRCE